MNSYPYTSKQFFEYQFYIDRDYFGFENLVTAINMLSQLHENGLLFTGHFFNQCKSTCNNEIPSYPLINVLDKETYNIWRSWYELKENDIKEL